MRLKKSPLTKALIVLAALISGTTLVTVARAAQLSLSEIPLYLGSSAVPNIMLMFDDSGSMDWQMSGDVGYLGAGATATPRHPEVQDGVQIAYECIQPASGGLIDLILNLTQNLLCLVLSETDDGGLLGLGVNVNLLNPPQFDYAYLFDEIDNIFPANDYTGGYLPIMLEEAYINPDLDGSDTNNDAPPTDPAIRPTTPPNRNTNPNLRPPRPRGSLAQNCTQLGGSPAQCLTSGNASLLNLGAATGGDCPNYTVNFSMYGDTDNDPLTNPSPGYWRVWNSTYNAIAYNPNVRYRPWPGKDLGGTDFVNAVPTAARLDPIDSTLTMDLTNPIEQGGVMFYSCDQDVLHAMNGNGQVLGKGRLKILDQPVSTSANPTATTQSCPNPINMNNAGACSDVTVNQSNWYKRKLSLFPARYYDWVDSNNDKLVAAGEPHQLVEIRSDTTNCSFGALCPTSFSRNKDRTDCAGVTSSGGNCTVAEELQNYANWFQYFRRRELSAKAAFTKIAAESDNTRMGVVVLNKNTNTKLPPKVTTDNDDAPTYAVQRRIMPMNPNIDSGNKKDLLDHLVRINAQGGTPLRDELNNAGQYLECNTNSNPYDYSGSNSYDFDHTADTGTDATIATKCPILNSNNGGACQSNFVIAMTDGFYNDNHTGTGNTDQDGTGNFDGGAYADTYSNTLGDIAMKYYESDLSTTLTNSMAIQPGIDEAPHQHMVTYGVAFGVEGRISGSNPTTNNDGAGMPKNPTAAFPWPNPASGDSEKIDDLRHASYNGRGKFFAAREPQKLIEALTDAVNDITSRASSASSVALNSGSLNTGTNVFQARFDSADWTGQLLAYPLQAGPGTPGCALEPIGSPCPLSWDAATVLNGQNWDTGRTILTYDTVAKRGDPFRWASLATSQQARLNKNLATNVADTRGSERLEYLRGRRSSETGTNAFRARKTVLGDIINSDPFFVGGPKSPYDSLSGYITFRSTYRNRTPVVYVGANDGMLHGFQADNSANKGKELIAFVPGDPRIYDDLPQLTLQDYRTANRHRYFVDGSPSVSDAQINGVWRSVLVSGMRRGGQSLYALDVTDPSQFSEANANSLVLWQFNDDDDADLGYTYSRPVVVKMANGKWAALVGNGYNSSESTTTDTRSGTGEACLFALFLEGPGADVVWAQGTEYRKICVTSGGPANDPPNGLSSPAAVDLNGDFVTDVIYAGDLEGNLWKFDVTSSTIADWSVDYSGKPLFTACSGATAPTALATNLDTAVTCSNTNRQPITVRPEVGPHPDGPATSHGVLVFFGTGKYFETVDNDTAAQKTQSFYMVYDQLWGAKSPAKASVATATPATVPTLPITKSQLVEQRITAEKSSSGGTCATDENCFRLTTNRNVVLTPHTGTPTKQGWYLNLLNRVSAADGTSPTVNINVGERNVSDPILRGDRIIFTTLIPSTSKCEFGGSGWLMELAFRNGGQTSQPPFDVNDDLKVDNKDRICQTFSGTNCDVYVPPTGKKSPIGIIPRPTVLAVTPEAGLPGANCMEFKYVSGSNGAIAKITESCDYDSGRLNWRQIR